MANVDITSAQAAMFGTHSHGEEGFSTRGGQYPAQLMWRDLHPAGLRVLPKGSPPAGPGEINWEDTLGGKFALAMEKLEGLLYAMFGSRPNGSPKRQWWDRLHPRCLWGPEAWERRQITPTPYCEANPGACWDYQETGKEYAALGKHPPCCPMPAPSVPIRSRSGDPAEQYRRGAHDRTYFPVGSVSRSHSAAPYDPEGSGWFGATRPGRQDGVGYEQKAGESVTFNWTRPDGVPEPTNVKLYYRTRPPGGAWNIEWSIVAMVGGPTYSVDLGPYSHGTEMQWAVRVEFAGDPAEVRFDPGGTSDPPASPYTLACFTHYNPYAHGLPETLDHYGDSGDVDIRHGTDFYLFDGSETIQPELLNLVRWVLSWLGGDCCTGEYENCAETDLRADAVQFNPRMRGGDDGDCCIYMPIRFRWSGSNVYPHYMTGGKAGPLDSRPLHNCDEDAGSQAARKTWRGINMLFTDAGHFDNVFYGGGYSWGTAPGTFTLMYRPEISEDAEVYAKYPSWGLRPGDVIEAVHLQEIIDAVDYLVDNGVWGTAPVYSTKRTPETYQGIECGTIYSRDNDNEPEILVHYCDKCCKPDPPCGDDPPICEPHDRPTWQACWEAASHAYCGMTAERLDAGTCEVRYGKATLDHLEYIAVKCDDDSGLNGCGTNQSEVRCFPVEPPDGVWSRAVNERVEGWSAFLCTPPACWGGWDANHGSGYAFLKRRYDHAYTAVRPYLQEVDTGPNGGESAGNCFGDMYACGDTFPGGEDLGAWFGEVVGVRFEGLASGVWWNSRNGDASCECWGEDGYAVFTDVPGLGQHDASGTPLCWQAVYYDIDGYLSAEVECNCTALDDVCLGHAVWVAVDLNLDGSGRPYGAFAGRNGDLEPYEGRGVPRLRDYDLTKDPETWMHECPCETWTGAATCEV